MSENPYQPPQETQGTHRWYTRPSIAIIAAACWYGTAVLLSNGARLAYGAANFDEYAARVSPTAHFIVKSLTIILVSASVASLLAAPVLFLLNRRNR